MHIPESLSRTTRRPVRIPLLLAALGLPLGSSLVRAQGELLPAPPPSAQTQPAETPQANNVLEIRILGNDTILTTQIDEHLSTRVGRPFDRSIVQRDVRRLANLGWFVDVKPLYKSTPQGQIVIFQVVERPTIRYVTYLGNEKVKDKTLAKQTSLKSGGAIDPYAVEEGRRKLIEFYQGKGYNNVQVTIMEGTRSTDKGIVYLMNEGNSQKVWDVEFVGNDFVSNGRLKTLIKSKPPKFLFFKGYLNREAVDVDVDRLTAYYRSFGFFQARVSRKLDYYPGKKWLKITYVIHEGLRYKIRDVRFLGNTKFEPAALAEVAKLKTGEPFEQTKVRADQKWIQELYGSHGYVFADIRPETVFLEEPGDLDLIYHIDEGEQFRIGNIYVNIGGDNPHTRIPTVLNRMSLRPGDIADIREINASRRRVQGSQLFHVDAASNVRPEITFRISEEDAEYALANRPRKQKRRKQTPPRTPQGPGSRGFGGNPRGGAGFRGQSPDNHHQLGDKGPEDWGPRVLPPPPATKKFQKVEKTVIRGQSPADNTKQPAWWSRLRKSRQGKRKQAQTVHKPAVNPYQHLRGQSPSTTTRERGPVQNAYTTLPIGGPPPQSGRSSAQPVQPRNRPRCILVFSRYSTLRIFPLRPVRSDRRPACRRMPCPDTDYFPMDVLVCPGNLIHSRRSISFLMAKKRRRAV